MPMFQNKEISYKNIDLEQALKSQKFCQGQPVGAGSPGPPSWPGFALGPSSLLALSVPRHCGPQSPQCLSMPGSQGLTFSGGGEGALGEVCVWFASCR